MSPRSSSNPGRGQRPLSLNKSFGDFTCLHCGQLVLANNRLSGVQNRNHCPYCLYSRHVDMRAAGDRLSACMGPMKPLGLTLKKTHKKYIRPGQGELMLIHQCETCGKLSINRIAADDDTQALWDLFVQSEQLDEPARQRLQQESIDLLQAADAMLVKNQLYGRQD
jgi:hypothetical protein